MMKKKLIVVLSVIFALSLSVLCFASCNAANATKSKYAVVFNTDGGSEVETQYVLKGSTAEKPDDPTKDGYIFEGWYLGEKEYDFSEAVRKAITLNARWTESITYEIVWKNADGTTLATNKVAEGAIPEYSGTPAKAADNT